MEVDDTEVALFNLSHLLSQEVPELTPNCSKFLHYSSLDAFYAMAETQRLRFTSAKSTNDPSEFIYGTDVVVKALDQLTKEHGDGPFGCLSGALDDLLDRTFSPFIFCMSEADEQESVVGELSQWRLYGSNGRGIALVFDISPLSSHKMLVKTGSYPRRVVYGEEEGIKLVKSVVTRFMRQLDDLPSHTKEELSKDFGGPMIYLVNCVFWLPSVIKHDAYRHEREVRLVRGDIGAASGNPLTFFERGGIRRPAIERDFAHKDSKGGKIRSPISGVIIGPSGDQSSIEDSVSYFMKSRDWDVDIHKSDIPYRALA